MQRTFRSFAKLNLHLEVRGRREDGYHELFTIFQSIDIHDEIDLVLGGRGLRLEVEGGGAPDGSDNIAFRAAEAFLDRWPAGTGVRIRLRKRIPVGGGLGGGSSNAATVLLGLRDLLEIRVELAELMRIGRTLGADVPYFLLGGRALGRGRGDELEALPDSPEREIWLVLPGVEVSTASVFGGLRDLTPRAATTSIADLLRGEGAAGPDSGEFWNDLLPAVRRLYPKVGEVYNALTEAGVGPISLTGSGATLFLYPSGATEPRDLQAVLPVGCHILTTKSLSRESFERLRIVN